MRSLLLKAFLNHFLGFVFGVVFMSMAFMATTCVTNMKLASTAVAVYRGDVEGYWPIEKLDNGWYLVEVRQRFSCDNPFWGKKKMELIIPHLVRMTESELLKRSYHRFKGDYDFKIDPLERDKENM